MYKTYSDDSVLGRAHALYDSTLQSKVETPENVGKFIAIDVDSGDFEVDRDFVAAVSALKTRRDTLPVVLRVGFPTTFQRGYSMGRNRVGEGAE